MEPPRKEAAPLPAVPPPAAAPPAAPAQAGAEAGAQADAALVAGLRAGEPRALSLVYGRYRARIYSFLVRLCGQRAEADDLFQETFLQLARHARSLRPDTDLAAWLFTVARNRYLSHRRTTLWRRLRLALSAAQEAAPAPLPAPHEQAQTSETARQLERALCGLSPPLREVLLLVGVEGLEQAQAAAVLGLSEAALRQRLSRARAQLRAQIEEDEAGARGKRPRNGGLHGA